jgi:hypothetical protein
MAAKTTTTTGEWDLGATWVGGVKPGVGDAATVAHAVTMATGTTAVADSITLTAGTITTNGTVSITTSGDIALDNDGVANITRNTGDLTITAAKIKLGPTAASGWITSTAAATGTITVNAIFDTMTPLSSTDSLIKTPFGTVIINGAPVLGGYYPLHCGNASGTMILNADYSGSLGSLVLVTNGTFIHNGSYTSPAANESATVYNITGTGSATINGNLTSASTSATAIWFSLPTSSTGSVTVNGNVSIDAGIIISASTTGATTWKINGTMTTTGASSVAIANTAAGIPTITVNGLIFVAGTGAKVFNLTSGVPVLKLNGGIAVAAGATLGTIPSTVALRIPATTSVRTSETPFGLNAGSIPAFSGGERNRPR